VNPAQHFLEYVLDFEKTCADDDWSGLERRFGAGLDPSYA